VLHSRGNGQPINSSNASSNQYFIRIRTAGLRDGAGELSTVRYQPMGRAASQPSRRNHRVGMALHVVWTPVASDLRRVAERPATEPRWWSARPGSSEVRRWYRTTRQRAVRWVPRERLCRRHHTAFGRHQPSVFSLHAMLSRLDHSRPSQRWTLLIYAQ